MPLPLKGRWRCLLKRNDTATEDIPILITACCVLHNTCEVHKEHFDDAWLQDMESDVPTETINNAPNQSASNTSAELIRQSLCRYMNS